MGREPAPLPQQGLCEVHSAEQECQVMGASKEAEIQAENELVNDVVPLVEQADSSNSTPTADVRGPAALRASTEAAIQPEQEQVNGVAPLVEQADSANSTPAADAQELAPLPQQGPSDVHLAQQKRQVMGAPPRWVAALADFGQSFDAALLSLCVKEPGALPKTTRKRRVVEAPTKAEIQSEQELVKDVVPPMEQAGSASSTHTADVQGPAASPQEGSCEEPPAEEAMGRPRFHEENCSASGKGIEVQKEPPQCGGQCPVQ